MYLEMTHTSFLEDLHQDTMDAAHKDPISILGEVHSIWQEHSPVKPSQARMFNKFTPKVANRLSHAFVDGLPVIVGLPRWSVPPRLPLVDAGVCDRH